MIKQHFVDYFKLFKIYDLKKLQKTGQVKIVQDKILMRKILSVQGTVSTQNYTTLICSNHPNILFKHQYLYLQAYCEPGKAFTFQITYFLSSKQYKIICSTMYKEDFKKKGDNLFHFRVKMPSDKWTVLAIDLYSLVNWDQSFKNDQDLRLGFRVANIEIRANSKVRGMIQSDSLYGPQNLPKQMQFPLRGEETFFQKYAFVVTGLNMSEELKSQIVRMKENMEMNEEEGKKDQVKKSGLNRDKSQQKSQQKVERKNVSRQRPRVSQQKGKQQKKPMAPKASKTQKGKKPQHNENNHQQQLLLNDPQQQMLEEQALQPPRPAASLNLKIAAVEGLSLVHESLISCESFLVEPVMLATHKKIVRMCKARHHKVLVAYADGSVCLWDTIRKEAGFYFRSELDEIKCLIMDHQSNIVIVGLDKLKREVISIVSQQAIIFKQISTFNIKSISLINPQSFQQGLISIGYENIRLWTISPKNNIINGYSVYLGKMARNVTYNNCCIVETIAGAYAFVADSQGYVTKVNVGEKKMEGVVKVDVCGVDHIRLVKYLNGQQKILIVNEKGTVKLLNCTTMESELEFALSNRIKTLWLKENPQNESVPNLILESYTKTIAELDLISSTLHYNTRSHYHQVTHIEYQKSKSKNSCLIEDKIVTGSRDSTMRVWKLIKTSDTEIALKEEYEFLINGQTISHICVSSPSSRTAQGFVYMVTDSNRIRKISLGSYQIVKEKSIPVIGDGSGGSKGVSSMLKVLSVSLNGQGKVLLIVCNQQVLTMDQELQVVQFKSLSSERFNSRKQSKNGGQFPAQQNHVSGFNSHKKSLYFYNPYTQSIEFYQLKDLQIPLFSISSPFNEMIMSVEWDSELVHCITDEEYQLYEGDSLLRVVPLRSGHLLAGKSSINCIAMNYPMLCVSYQLKQTGQNFISLHVLNMPGLAQTVKMPEKIVRVKLTKPINSPLQTQGFTSMSQNENWQGEIICAGYESHSMYALEYNILNMPDVMHFNNQNFQHINEDQRTLSFIDQKSQRNTKIPKIQNANISFITHAKDQPQNHLDISFSQTATLLMGNNFTNNSIANVQNHRKNNFIDSQYNVGSQMSRTPPAQLRRLYEEEEKVFQQCKKAVFGSFFDKDQDELQQQAHQFSGDQEVDNEEQRQPESGKVKMKMFFGVDSRQSLRQDIDPMLGTVTAKSKKTKQWHSIQLGQFHWSSQDKQITLLTNMHKSLLIHEFTQPTITQRLLHLYSKPTSICWSGHQTSKQQVSYYIVCYNSIIKLYNARNRMSFIRSIQNDTLIRDKHVVFSSFVTTCNTFLVVLTYRLDSEIAKGKDTQLSECNKLYIFVLELSSGKIVSSSYKQVSAKFKSKQSFDKSIRQSYQLKPNRYSQNSQLEFILLSPNQLSFYRVTSMFTLQMLQLQEIKLLTKEKTENLVTTSYVKIQGDVYLLIGTENGSLIIVDSRSGAVVLVLVNLLAGRSSGKSEPIGKVQFIQEGPYVDGKPSSYAKLIFSGKGSNSLQVITLTNGINSLIQQVQMSSTTILSSNPSSSGYESSYQQHSMIQMINLDSQITSVSTINNSTQQLVLTKSSTLWLVDYDDLCSIKIFSAHSEPINEAYLLRINNNEQPNAMNKNDKNTSEYFISCSEDGYVKVSDTNKVQQQVQIYKPRKAANCLEINGSYTVCGFKDQLYFYDSMSQSLNQLSYLGSLQFENQTLLRVKNIPFSHNYYLLTQVKLYIIYVKRKQPTHSLSKSTLSIQQSQVTKSFNHSQIKSTHSLPKVHIQIEIQEITTFPQTEQSKLSHKPLWIEINPYRPYDQFSIGFRGGKVDTWQRKCLKRTLNPLEQLSNVRSLEYYLTDVYNRKQTLQPYIQFASERQYMISLSELNKIQLRNYKDHAIIREIAFSQQFLEGIKTFRYFVMPQKKVHIHSSSHQQDLAKIQGKAYFNHLANFKKGPLILVGDQFGYLSVCDMNGLVIEKEKVFNSPIESIEVHPQTDSHKVAFSVFVKSSHFVSLLSVYH